MVKYLKMNELIPFGLYAIDARNGNYGIWIPEHEGFVLSRHKFGHNFMFLEHHWDCPAWATAKPIKFIEQSPFEAPDFEYIIKTSSEGGESHDWRSHHEIVAYLNKFEGTLEERTARGSR